jgi:hypothetical protein
MAASTIITASNGWKMRPLKETDYQFFMESFADYPLGNTSYRSRQNKFSGCIHNNSLYDDAVIKSGNVTQADGVQSQGIIRTYVIEHPDETPVGIEIRIHHEPHLCVTRGLVIHPLQRGKKYLKPCHIMGYGLSLELSITTSRAWLQETSPFETMTHMKPKYDTAGLDRDFAAEVNAVDIGSSDPIRKMEGGVEPWEQIKATTTGWADVTYTVS